MYKKQGFYSGQPLEASKLAALEEGVIEAQELAKSTANMEKGRGTNSTQQKPDTSRVNAAGLWNFNNSDGSPRNPNAAYDGFSGDKDYGATGAYSATIGGSNLASGPRSVAINNRTIAAGDECFAMGYCSVAGGDSSLAGGSKTYAKGEAAVSLGDSTQALGKASMASGGLTVASGDYAHTEGYNTSAMGDSAHSEGVNTSAIGDHSHAGGSNSAASGYAAFAHGVHANADYNYQFVVGVANDNNNNNIFEVGNGELSETGEITKRSNAFSVTRDGRAKVLHGPNGEDDNDVVDFATLKNVAIGIRNDINKNIKDGTADRAIQQTSCSANKEYSVAIGARSIANGAASFAGGVDSVAKGDHSTAIGTGVYTSQAFQTVVGKYNSNQEYTLFEIGNGSNSVPSNAFEVHSDGTVGILHNGQIYSLQAILQTLSDKLGCDIFTENTKIPRHSVPKSSN